MPDINAYLEKIIQVYTTEAPDFPYTMTIFGTDTDTNDPITYEAVNTGATDEETFIADTLLAAGWNVIN